MPDLPSPAVPVKLHRDDRAGRRGRAVFLGGAGFVGEQFGAEGNGIDGLAVDKGLDARELIVAVFVGRECLLASILLGADMHHRGVEGDRGEHHHAERDGNQPTAAR